MKIFIRLEVGQLIGFIVSEQESKELNFTLKAVMDEMLYDLADKRLDTAIKDALRIRFKRVYGLFSRTASADEKRKYIEQFNKFAKGK